MATLHGTPIDKPITPGLDDRNQWATHYARFGAGGFEVVEDIAARDAIDDERKLDKLVMVKDDGNGKEKFYLWEGGSWVSKSIGEVDWNQIDSKLETSGYLKGISVSNDDTSHLPAIRSIEFEGATLKAGDTLGSVVVSGLNSGSSNGISMDDGTTSTGGVLDLFFKSTELTPDVDDTTKMQVEPFTTFTDGHDPYRANTLQVLAPLQTWSDPNKEMGGMLEIKKGTFESMKAPSFLAYLDYDEFILGKRGESDKHHKGSLWFNDVVYSGGPYIETKKNQKTYGIQEADTLDPNITGGMNYLIAFRVSMKGEAQEEGVVEAYLRGHTVGVSDSEGFLLDVNGFPMAVRKHYKKGDKLGYLDVIGVVNSKGLKEFTCNVADDFSTTYVELNDRVEGGTGLLIQALTSEYKTGPGLLQFEEDTSQDIRFSSVYMGEGFSDINWVTKNNIPVTRGNAGEEAYMPDGYYFYNNTPVKLGVENNQLAVTDDGTDMAYYSFGKIFNSETTSILRAHKIKVLATLTNPNNAFNIGLYQWTKAPNTYTKPIITDINSGQQVLADGWALVDSLFVAEEASGEPQDVEKVFTIPNTANNFAVVITPNAKESPSTLRLGKFQIDVSTPFTGVSVEAPELKGEMHLIESDQYKETRQDAKGLYSLRYTIDQADTPMPVGRFSKGRADITLDTTVNQVTGSGAGGGEGALKFMTEGNAKVSTQVNVFNEGQADSIVSFWYSTVGPDGSLTKIPDSEGTLTIHGNTKNLIYTLPQFSIDVNAGDRIAFTAKADKDDGAYLQAYGNSHTPLVLINIIFKEIVENTGYEDDSPDLISAPLDKYLNIDRRSITFQNHNSPNYVTHLEIPDDVDLASHSVVGQVGNTITVLDGTEFSYNTDTHTLTVHKGNLTNGKIYLEFWG